MKVLVLTAVGAAIGFGTNLIAIVMLFRPWREWRVFGMRVPLTPGLIPKRQPEIAQKLGAVVEEHLLTGEGVASSLHRPEWVADTRDRVLAWLESALAKDRTVRELAGKLTELDEEQLFEQAEKWLRFVVAARVSRELETKRVGDLLPPAVQEQVEAQVGEWAGKLLNHAARWVDSPSARRLMAAAIQERLESGGMIGRVANLFVREDKLVDELIPHFKNWLGSPAILRFVRDKLQAEWKAFLDRNAKTVLVSVLNVSEDGGLETNPESGPHVIGDIVKAAVENLLKFDVYEWLRTNRSLAAGWLDRFLTGVRRSSAAWAAPVLQTLGIRRVVERQIASFPVPKLERLVVDVVKKELQMIAWLGALLGGLIGLIQALLIIGWP